MAEQIDARQAIATLSMELHAGTFNGCMETITKSLDLYLSQLVAMYEPMVDLDRPFPAGLMLSFLTNNQVKVYFKGGTNKRYHNIPRVLSHASEEFIKELKDNVRNPHVHAESMYPRIAVFAAIRIPLGNDHCLVFNPDSRTEKAALFNNNSNLIDGVADGYRCVFRRRSTADQKKMDMTAAGQEFADLYLEVLTKVQFRDARERLALPENARQWPQKAAYAVVITYGRIRHIIFVSKTQCDSLRKAFVYEPGEKWRQHYFRFSAESLFTRLMPAIAP